MANRTQFTQLRGSFTESLHYTDGDVQALNEWIYPDAKYWRRVQIGSGSRPDQSGWRSPTRYYASVAKHVAPEGVCRSRHVSGPEFVFEGQDGSAPKITSVPAFPAGLRQQAEVSALLKLKDTRVNLAVAFAERDATARMLGDSARRIGAAYRQARKGNFKRAAGELGAKWRKSTSNWLELQYGWKPLLSDVYGAAEALSRSKPKDWMATVKGSKQERTSKEEHYVLNKYSYDADVKVDHGCFVRLDYEPSNTFLSALTSVGATNPLEVIWEKVPLSFIVDWAWSIGDWLSAMDADYGFRIKSGSVSMLTRGTMRVRPGNDFSSPFIRSVSNGLKGGSSSYTRLEREPQITSPLPRPPSFSNPVSVGHMANGLSLLAEAFGRRR